MDKIIKKIFNDDINMDQLVNMFLKLDTTFNPAEHSAWLYSFNHLPLSIFIQQKKPINYILHLPGDHYKGAGDIYTFDGMPLGWPVYNNQDIKCECRIVTNDCCEIHINLRDIYTDICEFMSNLILHVAYMKLNSNEVIVVYKNTDDCIEWKSCGAILKSNRKKYKKINKNSIITEVSLKTPPTYTVKINKLTKNSKTVLRRAEKDCTKLYEDLYSEINELIEKKVKSKNFNIHIIQGAQGTFKNSCTSKIDVDTDNIKLTGKYGGKHENYDKYIAKLKKSGKNYIKSENDKWLLKHKKTIRPETSQTTNILFMNHVIPSKTMDPVFLDLIKNTDKSDNLVLINIGYAFGSEAKCIANALKRVFKKKIVSFQVIGKAGGIGKGINLSDYIFADKLTLSHNKSFGIDDKNKSIKMPKYKLDKTLLSGNAKNAFTGTVDIQPSVVFQDKKYLKKLVKEKTIAIEMEGYWYSLSLKNIPQIYLYYISDTPLIPDQNLAHESWPRDEGQTLFNGLLRTGFKWIETL